MAQIIQLAQMNASIHEWGVKLGSPSTWYWVEAMIEGTARDGSKFLGGNQMLRNIFATVCMSSVLAGGMMAGGVLENPVLADGPHDFLSGTYLDPAMQRPDFLPHTITSKIPEHRQVYNRPRYIPGWLAYKIEPSSQEAMAWQTNYCNGNYRNHAGAYIPVYNYPKPWEAMNTRARPDTKSNVSMVRGPGANPGVSASGGPGYAPAGSLEAIAPAQELSLPAQNNLPAQINSPAQR